MALMKTIRCVRCNLLSDEDIHTVHIISNTMFNEYPSGTCSYCAHKEKETNKAVYLRGLESLTIEDRIKKVEEWIYDHNMTNHNRGEVKYR